MKKQKKIIIVASVLLVLVVVIGASYAIWISSLKQEQENVLATDCFEFSLIEETNSIKLNKAYPITDEEGLTLPTYNFTIKNTCQSRIHYNINLETLDSSTLKEQYLKIAWNNESISILSDLPNVTPINNNMKNAFLLKEGYLAGEESKSFTLGLWMGDYVTSSDTDAMNKSYLGKVAVVGYYTHELKKEINYHLNGGNFREGYVAPKLHTYGSTLMLPTASNVIKEELVLEGWYDNPEFLGSPYTQIDIYNENDVELYAKYRNPQILYDAGGATYNYNALYYTTWEGTDITLSNDVRMGSYTFEGWYLDNTYTKPISLITKDLFKNGEDLQIFGKWNVVTDYWYYEKNTTDPVENMPDNQLFIQGQITKLSSKVPVREGYSFVSWSSRGAQVLGAWNDFLMPSSEVGSVYSQKNEHTLLAIWKKKEDFTINGLQYRILSNDTVEVSGRNNKEEVLTIPATVFYGNKTYKIVKIADYAFAHDQNIKSLITNEGLEMIGRGSFYNCQQLNSIKFADSISNIDGASFKKNLSLTKVALPRNLTILKEGTFLGSQKLSEIIWNEKLVTIENAAVHKTAIKEFILPDSVETFDIQHMPINKIYIGPKLKKLLLEVGANAEIIISPENNLFKYENNFLTSKDGKILYGYGGDRKNITVPNGIQKLERHSLSEIVTSDPIILPNSVEVIDYRAFFGTTAPEVNIPLSVTSIEASAFGSSDIKIIKIYKPINSISGSPWGSTSSDIQWLG